MIKNFSIFELIKKYWFLILILLVGILLRSYKILFQDLSFEELFFVTQAHIDFSFSKIINSFNLIQSYPPFFPLLLNLWFKFTSYNDLSAKLLSVIAGFFSLFTCYCLGREVFSKKCGYIACIILAIDINHISYSRTAAPHIFIFLLTTLSFLYLIKIIKEYSILNFTYYIIFTGLMMITHPYGVLITACQIFCFLMCISNKNVLTFYKFMSAIILMSIIYSVFFSSVFHTINFTPRSIFYAPMSIDFIINSEPLYIILCVLMIIRVFYYYFNRYMVNENIKLSLPIIIFWIILFCLFIHFISWDHLADPPYRLWPFTLPAIIILIAMGSAVLKNRTMYIVVFCFIVLSAKNIFISRHFYTTTTSGQWTDLVQYVLNINKNDYKNEAIPILSNEPDKFQYYLASSGADLTILPAKKANLQKITENTLYGRGLWFIEYQKYKPQYRPILHHHHLL